MDGTVDVLQSPTFLSYSFDASASHAGNHAGDYEEANLLDHFIHEEVLVGLPFATLQSPDETSRSIPLDTPLHARKRKAQRSARLPIAARKLLIDWFDDHISHPYPGNYELSNLVRDSGLTVKQVRTFFTNRRARRASSTPSTSGSQFSNSMLMVDAIGVPNTDQPLCNHELEITSGYGSSALKDDCTEPIIGLNFNKPFTPFHEGLQHSLGPLENLQETESHSGISVDFGEWPSELSSIISANASTTNRRKGKRRYCNLISSDVIENEKIKTYQCTFCRKEFLDKYRWRRHEESVHLPQSDWVCMSHQPISLTENGPECTFCSLLYPSNEHLNEHNYLPCSQRPISARTFTRKDYLQRHVRQFHHTSQWTTHMDEWNKPISLNHRFTCGFCGTKLDGWKSRVDHIAGHFEDGLRMSSWTFISKVEQLQNCSMEIPGHDMDNLTSSLGAMLADNEHVVLGRDPYQEVQDSKSKGTATFDHSVLDNGPNLCQRTQQCKTVKSCWLDTWLSDQVNNFYIYRIPDLFLFPCETDFVSSAVSDAEIESTDPSHSEIVCVSNISSITITGLAEVETSESLEPHELVCPFLSDIPSDMDHLLLTGAWAWDLKQSIWKIEEHDIMTPQYRDIVTALGFVENLPPPAPVLTTIIEEFGDLEMEMTQNWRNFLDVLESEDFDSAALLEQAVSHP